MGKKHLTLKQVQGQLTQPWQVLSLNLDRKFEARLRKAKLVVGVLPDGRPFPIYNLEMFWDIWVCQRWSEFNPGHVLVLNVPSRYWARVIHLAAKIYLRAEPPFDPERLSFPDEPALEGGLPTWDGDEEVSL